MTSTICLNMIVRDEAHVIQRCLRALRPVIDSWVIVDTGSIDGTQGAVCEALVGIPGELYERPWVDFGTNRTQALALAKGRACVQPRILSWGSSLHPSMHRSQ